MPTQTGRPAVKQVHGIGAEQDELAMSEIENAHHAGDHTEAEHHQHEDGAEKREHVEDDADDVLHGYSLDFRTGSQSPGP